MGQITMLSVVLAGAALIREREHGTVEHLVVMPFTPAEIMVSKIWSMGLVVWIVAFLSLMVVVQGVLAVPIHGSIPLFMLATALQLYATTAMGIALATLAASMPQFALLLVLTLLPMQLYPGRRRRGKTYRISFRTSCWPRLTPTSSCWCRAIEL
jgi:ABC-2 type transport system permease protein